MHFRLPQLAIAFLIAVFSFGLMSAHAAESQTPPESTTALPLWQAVALGAPPGFELAPGAVAHDGDGIKIIHPGAAEGAVGGRKSGRLDDVRLDAATRTQPQDGSGVLRDVGLIKG